ncbi:MAG: hypothetical protein ACFBSE_10365 [Prochloraceae cyanobacterium]
MIQRKVASECIRTGHGATINLAGAFYCSFISQGKSAPRDVIINTSI